MKTVGSVLHVWPAHNFPYQDVFRNVYSTHPSFRETLTERHSPCGLIGASFVCSTHCSLKPNQPLRERSPCPTWSGWIWQSLQQAMEEELTFARATSLKPAAVQAPSSAWAITRPVCCLQGRNSPGSHSTSTRKWLNGRSNCP